MDEELYDEFGNYIGPDLGEGSAESESEQWDGVPVAEPGALDAMDVDERTLQFVSLKEHVERESEPSLPSPAPLTLLHTP